MCLLPPPFARSLDVQLLVLEARQRELAARCERHQTICADRSPVVDAGHVISRSSHRAGTLSSARIPGRRPEDRERVVQVPESIRDQRRSRARSSRSATRSGS